MCKIRFTGHQIIAVLKSVEAGRTVKDVCREAAIFLRPPLEWRKIGVDGGSGPAGDAHQLGDGHHVMAPQAAPAAGFKERGAEHPGDDVQERGHGLPAAGRIQRQQVGPGRADRSILN